MLTNIIGQTLTFAPAGVTPTLSNNLFLAEIGKPEWETGLHYLYKHYNLTFLLDNYLGDNRKLPIAQEFITHTEIGLTREVMEIADGRETGAGGDVSDNTPAAGQVRVTLSTNSDFPIVSDVVRIAGSDKQGRIIAVDTGAGTIDLAPQKVGDTLSAADFEDAGDKLTLIYTAFEEHSDAPLARTHEGETVESHLTRSRKTVEISTTEYSNMKWIQSSNGNYYWWDTQQAITLDNLFREKEILAIIGQESDVATSGARSSQGFIPAGESGGLIADYAAGTMDEDLLIDYISEYKKINGASRALVLAGNTWMKTAAKAMRDYMVGGGVQLGNFSAAQLGINLSRYQFNGLELDILEYDLFNDPSVFPQIGTGRDYQDFALFLNTGTMKSGDYFFRPLTKSRPNGGDYSFQMAEQPGMANPVKVGGRDIVSTGKDGSTIFMACYSGLQIIGKNGIGIMQGK